MIAALDYGVGARWLLKNSVPPGLTVLAVLAAYVVGHGIAHLSGVVVEQWFVRRVLRSPEEHMIAASPARTRWRALFPGTFVPLPETTRRRLLAKAESAGVFGDARAIFFHCHARVKRDPATLERLSTFLNLYGFCRNLATALLLSGVLLIGAGLARAGRPTSVEATNSIVLGLLCIPMSYLLLLRYLKFFRHYTLEVFLSYAEEGG